MKHCKLGGLFLLGAALAGCREPTQITLEVSTDIPCDEFAGITIAAGELPGLQDQPPSATTTRCDPDTGRIGSIVLLPADSNDEQIAFQVTAGYNKLPDGCSEGEAGCVVARRVLRFIPHTPLELSVMMQKVCAGVLCDPSETCFSAQCVPATIDPERCRVRCDGPDLFPNVDGGLLADGGAPDSDAGDQDRDGGASTCTSVAKKPLGSTTRNHSGHLVSTEEGFALSWAVRTAAGTELRVDRFDQEGEPLTGASVTSGSAGTELSPGPVAFDAEGFATVFDGSSTLQFARVGTNGSSPADLSSVDILPISGLFATPGGFGLVAADFASARRLVYLALDPAGAELNRTVLASDELVPGSDPTWLSADFNGSRVGATWIEFRSERQCFVGELTHDGAWLQMPRRLSDLPTPCYNPRIAGAPSGFGAAFHTVANGARSVHFVRLAPGATVLDEPPLRLSASDRMAQDAVVTRLPDGYAVTWRESTSSGNAIVARRVYDDGSLGAVTPVAETTGEGFSPVALGPALGVTFWQDDQIHFTRVCLK